jgi:uncharacterized Zn finger protein (UPF0148 family)
VTTTKIDFGAPLTLAPSLTVRRPCAACGLTYLRAKDAAHHLCAHCAGDLAATRAHVEQMAAGIREQIGRLNEAEALRVDALDEEISERWGRAYHAWHSADRQLTAAQRQKWPSATPLETRAQAVRDARARLEAVEAKLARTEAAGGPMGAAVAARAEAPAGRARALAAGRRRGDALRRRHAVLGG